MAQLATIAAFGFADFDPPSLLKLYRQFGCRTCQFYRNPMNPPTPSEARQIAEDAGLPIDSIHGLFGPELDPSSPDESVRQESVETYRFEGELALELGGPRVVVHPAPRAGSVAEVTRAVNKKRVDPLRKLLVQLAELGAAQGVTYLIENLPGDYYFGPDPGQLAELVREAASPHVRMCFDTGHAHMTVGEATGLRSCRDVVTYLHVHDNNSRLDAHNIPGLVPDGAGINWPALAPLIAELPAAIPAMLELFEPQPLIEAQLHNGLPAKLKQWLALR